MSSSSVERDDWLLAVAGKMDREPDCGCGHPMDDHVNGVGCMAPAEFHTGDVFCACTVGMIAADRAAACEGEE